MFNFSKRINRLSYLAGALLSVIILIFIDITQALLDAANEDYWGKNGIIDLFIGLFILVGLAVFILLWLSVVRRRANDMGWHPLLVTAVSFWTPLWLVLILMPGSKQSNKFGDVPQDGIDIRHS